MVHFISEIPQELIRLYRGRQINVNMVKKDTEYVKPKETVKAFSGAGHTLGRWECWCTLRYQLVQTQTTTAYYRILSTVTRPLRLSYFFRVVQTQTTTAYCRILPTLDHHV